MKRGTTTFLKVAIFLIWITLLVLCIFGLPWLSHYTVEMFPEFSYLRYPVLVGLYVTMLPFCIALYQSIRLLMLIENNNAFSTLSVKALKSIKYCAVVIAILYGIGSIFLFSQNALHPGIALIGFAIIFASIVIAVFTVVLLKLLNNALEIKLEHDLTV